MRFTITSIATVTLIVSPVILALRVPRTDGQKIGVAIPLTKYSRLVNADESVNFEVVDLHVESIYHKILRGLENYEVNIGVKDTHDTEDIGERAENGIPLVKETGFFWYGPVEIGTPAQSLTVVFDTGSCDLIVPNITCDHTCDGHNRWDPTKSSTAKKWNREVEEKFGDGIIVNIGLYTDTVSVGGLTATKQAIGAAISYPRQFQQRRFGGDGLMGLGFPATSAIGAKPFLHSLYAQGQLSDFVFSMKFSAQGAELYLGGINFGLFTGSFTFIRATTQRFWQVDMDNIQVGGKVMYSNIPAIIDTGSAFIFAPLSQIKKLYDRLPGPAFKMVSPGYYGFLCDNFPTVTLTFGGTTFPISQEALNVGPVKPGSPVCFSGLIGKDVPISNGAWVIGLVFLQNVYTVFDFRVPQVGFVSLAQSARSGID